MDRSTSRGAVALLVTLLLAVLLAPAAVAAPPASRPSPLTTLHGRVTWTNPDARGEIVVFGCRRVNTDQPCDELRATTVDSSGRYQLPLGPGAWTVSPMLQADGSRLTYPATTVFFPRLPRPLDFTVTGRVVEVRIQEQDGQAFPDETGMVFCEAWLFELQLCPDNSFGVGVGVDYDRDGDALIAVEPHLTYRLAAFAKIGEDSSSWAYSPPLVTSGAALAEGTVFVIDVP